MSRGSMFFPRRQSAGFTLIELMVAMLIGLIVIGGVTSVFLSNQQVYRSNKALGDVQDSSRIAFEMMARDIRSAGMTGCDNSGRVANVLNNGPSKGGTTVWANWANNVTGYTGTQAGAISTFGTGTTTPSNRVSGTEAVLLIGAQGSGYSILTDSEPAATFTLNETTTDLAAGNIIIVCDPDHATVMQITGFATGTVTHAASGTPGNCTTDSSYPTVCSSGNSYVFAPNAQLAKVYVAEWYVGNSVDGTGAAIKSLFRTTLSDDGTSVTAAEMVPNVTNMSITYLPTGNTDFVAASSVTNWLTVQSVRVTLTMESVDKRAGTDIKPISRSFTSTTTIRNRVN